MRSYQVTDIFSEKQFKFHLPIDSVLSYALNLFLQRLPDGVRLGDPLAAKSQASFV